MIEDFDLEELEELFAEFEIEAGEDGISDPGPEKYDQKNENRKRKLMEHAAFYAEEGPTWDPEGKYLCGSCYYRELMDWGDTPACYIVEGKISMETGSCQFYRYGNPDPEWNPLPMKKKYTKEAANYAERPKEKGFGCYPRCDYGKVAEGVDPDGREIWCGQFGVHVRPKACCAFEDGPDLVQIEAGGPGSGCQGENCGRPRTGIKTGFALVDGRYEWSGPVKPENIKVSVRKNKYSEVAKAAAEFVGARLFADGPIHVDIIWDNAIGSKSGAHGASSTNEDGTHTQVYLVPKKLMNAEDVAGLVAHELAHTWQNRNGWTDYAPEGTSWFDRPEEKHATELGQLLGNEFVIKEGSKFGIEPAKWLNTPAYFKGFAERLSAGGPGSGCNPEAGKCGRPEGPAKDASFYMKEKIGGPQGTNPGGMYKGEDGVYRYVKLYGKDRQARCEYLSNEIYKGLHIAVPDSVLFKREGGKETIANVQVEGKTIQQMGTISANQAKQFMDGFAADVLTANWDAVGTGKDNIFVDSKGEMLRLDQGGTLLMRAKGGDKPDSALNSISETTKFFDKNVNPYYTEVAKVAGVKSAADLGEKSGTNSLKAQVNVITSLRDSSGGWAKFVDDKVPDMPKDERTKIVGMLEARTNLLQSMVLGMDKGPTSALPTDEQNKKALESLEKPSAVIDKAPAKGRDWSNPSSSLVGGFFRSGTVVGQVYTKLSQNEGQWQKISEIKKDLEDKIGKPLYNISQNTLKQGGKKSGLWQVEISGDSIRMYITKPGEKSQVAEVSDDKQKIAADYAIKFAKIEPDMKSDSVYKQLVGEYFEKMGVPSASQKEYQSTISSWAGSANTPQAQNLRQIGMDFYGRKPSGEHVGSNTKVFNQPMTKERAKLLEPAVMAMKALSGMVHTEAGTQYVYRNIIGTAAKEIAESMREAEKAGKDSVPIPFNSISCFSTRSTGGYNSGQIKVRMKVDPENIWSTYRVMPYEFLKGEREVLVGIHQPEEIFSLKDISVEGSFAGYDLYSKYNKDFSKKGLAAAKDDEKPLDVYWDAKITPFDGDEEQEAERKKLIEKQKEDEKKKK